MKRLTLICLLLLCSPLQLFACGPSPQKVVKQVTVHAEPDVVWAVVSDIANMQAWHPNVKTSMIKTVKDLEGNPKTYRTLILENGGKLVERIRPATSNAMKLGVVIEEGSLAVSSYSDALTVKPGSTQGTSIVTWVGRFNNKANLLVAPKGQDNEAAIADVTKFYTTGLNQLKQFFNQSSI